MLIIGLVVLLGCIALSSYVRMASSDPQLWHVDLSAAQDPGVAGTLRVLTGAGPDGMFQFETALLAEPRTEVFAGSAAGGHVTYIARSRLFGFPDYITAQLTGDDLKVLSRLRFGRSDLGVNAARLKRVFERLDATD